MTTATKRLHSRVSTKANKDGTYTFVGSTPRVDRVGESISPSWDLDAYKQNPVVLYQHDHDALPIGKAEDVYLDGEKLMFKVRFVPKDIYPFAETVRLMYEKGFMSTVSVGFRPIDQKGSTINHSELLELSVVAVPCNADALLADSTKSLRPVFRKRPDGPPPGDATKLKAWLIAAPITTEKTMTTKADSATAGSANAVTVGDKIADGVDLKSMADVKQLMADALEACKAGAMDECQAGLEAALAAIDAMDAETEAAPADGAEAPPAAPAPKSDSTKGREIEALAKRVEALERGVRPAVAATKSNDDEIEIAESDLGAFVDEVGDTQ